MPIDQQLLVPTLPTSSGDPSMTIAELVTLMNGGSVPIDQTLLIPTLKGCAGLPAETIAAIVALSSGAAAATTSSLIESYNVANFWLLNQEFGDQFGNHGRRPVTGVPFVVAPDSADSTPMVSEPANTATFFDGTAACLAPATIAIPYTLATGVLFVKAASFASNFVFWQHGNAGGAFKTRLQNLGVDAFLLVFDSGADEYNVVFTLPSNIGLNTWHMVGWRQPVNGVGVDFFFDGTFFANASAEVVNSFAGVGDVDFSFNDANTAGADRFAIGSQSDTGLSNKLTGSMFHHVIDDKVWTDTQLSDLWDQAIASGLNA